MANCSGLIKRVASTGNGERGQQSALITSPAFCGRDFAEGAWLGWVVRVHGGQAPQLTSSLPQGLRGTALRGTWDRLCGRGCCVSPGGTRFYALPDRRLQGEDSRLGPSSPNHSDSVYGSICHAPLSPSLNACCRQKGQSVQRPWGRGGNGTRQAMQEVQPGWGKDAQERMAPDDAFYMLGMSHWHFSSIFSGPGLGLPLPCETTQITAEESEGQRGKVIAKVPEVIHGGAGLLF